MPKTTPKLVEGSLSAKGLRFALVVSRFNDFVSQRLVEGAVDCINRHGESDATHTVYKVPGAFDIPPTAMKLALPSILDPTKRVGLGYIHLFAVT